jgi:hypothetical protein
MGVKARGLIWVWWQQVINDKIFHTFDGKIVLACCQLPATSCVVYWIAPMLRAITDSMTGNYVYLCLFLLLCSLSCLSSSLFLFVPVYLLLFYLLYRYMWREYSLCSRLKKKILSSSVPPSFSLPLSLPEEKDTMSSRHRQHGLQERLTRWFPGLLKVLWDIK